MNSETVTKLLDTLALSVCALALSSCQQQKADGVVVEKHYSPPRTTYQLVGKVLVPIKKSREFTLTIQNDTTGCTVSVGPAIFSRASVGDSAIFRNDTLVIKKRQWPPI
ncbi:MAG: hypothetical protein JFR38_08595 [Muribaculaceae bacterium]|nr:hypothetical protein [Muribaculaceae bacterium]